MIVAPPLDSASSWLSWSNVLYVGGAALTVISAMYVLYENRAVALGKRVKFYLLSEIVVLSAAFISLVGTIGAVHYGRVVNKLKDDDLAAYKISAQVQISQANRDAASANSVAGIANKNAAEANGHLADANKQAAEANAQAAKAEAQIASAAAASRDAIARVAIAESHVTDASEKAEAFRLEIAKANQSAAGANARAAEAQVELAKFRSPRNLTPEQQKRIASHLLGFDKNQNVFLTAAPVTVESRALAQQIFTTIKMAVLDTRWFPGGTTIDPMTNTDAVSGVVVFSTGDDRSKTFSDLLVRELNAEGISASSSNSLLGCERLNQLNPNDPYCFHVMVVIGPKP